MILFDVGVTVVCECKLNKTLLKPCLLHRDQRLKFCILLKNNN